MDNNNNSSNPNVAQRIPTPGQPIQQPQAKKPKSKKILIIVLIIALLAGSSFGGVLYGKQTANKANDRKNAKAAELTAPKSIDLPKEAIVLNECTPGRGKQYIEPKNIPFGPIYDVRNTEVIAIEYSLGIKALFANTDAFSNTLMSLIKDNPVDHFDIAQQAPKAGDTDQMINLIMFVVSKEESAKIICTATTTPATTTPATTTPATPAAPATTTPATPAAPANPAI